MKFLHLSDLHIHTDGCSNIEVQNTLEYIDTFYPDHKLIITGDITDDGSSDQYEKAFALLKRFMGRIFICPGNHDFGAAGNLYSRERALRFDELAKQLNQGGTFTGDNTPVVNIFREDSSNIMLIALDSNLETESPFDFACGKIGKYQLRCLQVILDTNPNLIKVLFFHHHPFAYIDNPFLELKDARELAKVVFNKVNVMLFGHQHVMGQWDGTWGIEHILASDNSPGKDFAKEVEIVNGVITVRAISIKPTSIKFHEMGELE